LDRLANPDCTLYFIPIWKQQKWKEPAIAAPSLSASTIPISSVVEDEGMFAIVPIARKHLVQVRRANSQSKTSLLNHCLDEQPQRTT
jgi:hypothetical protein